MHYHVILPADPEWYKDNEDVRPDYETGNPYCDIYFKKFDEGTMVDSGFRAVEFVVEHFEVGGGNSKNLPRTYRKPCHR